MELKSVMKVFASLLLALSMPIASFAQDKVKERPRELSKRELKKLQESASLKIPGGASFFIERIEQQPNNFSLLLSDADNRSVADSFSLRQIQVFEAVMVEAIKFAESKEGVGTMDAPTVTRFVDKKEPSFIVDVEKAGIQSKFYITLDCLTGHLTVDAGTIKRDGKEHETLFSRLLLRFQDIQSMKSTTLQQ
jgi:hypothetical protein